MAKPSPNVSNATTRPDRPPRASGASRTGSRPGFTEDETKDLTVSSGGGLSASTASTGPAGPQSEPDLSQDDPDHDLRGEDQLVDGTSEVVEPDALEEE